MNRGRHIVRSAHAVCQSATGARKPVDGHFGRGSASASIPHRGLRACRMTSTRIHLYRPRSIRRDLYLDRHPKHSLRRCLFRNSRHVRAAGTVRRPVGAHHIGIVRAMPLAAKQGSLIGGTIQRSLNSTSLGPRDEPSQQETCGSGECPTQTRTHGGQSSRRKSGGSSICAARRECAGEFHA